MAKAIITFTDTEDGSLTVGIEFEPNVAIETNSPAQVYAMKAIQYVTNLVNKETEEGK